MGVVPKVVYRVVNSEGDGAYKGRGRSLVNIVKDETEHYDWQHYHTPAPEDDGIPEVPDGWLFGFASERQMFRWFPPIWWMEAKKLGGLVTLWSVCPWDMIEGKNQVMFNSEKAKLIDIIPCAIFKIGV